LTERIIGRAIGVHRTPVRGYWNRFAPPHCARELEGADIHVQRKVGIPAMCKH
jgi:hypothetical protein